MVGMWLSVMTRDISQAGSSTVASLNKVTRCTEAGVQGECTRSRLCFLVFIEASPVIQRTPVRTAASGATTCGTTQSISGMTS